MEARSEQKAVPQGTVARACRCRRFSLISAAVSFASSNSLERIDSPLGALLLDIDEVGGKALLLFGPLQLQVHGIQLDVCSRRVERNLLARILEPGDSRL